MQGILQEAGRVNHSISEVGAQVGAQDTGSEFHLGSIPEGHGVSIQRCSTGSPTPFPSGSGGAEEEYERFQAHPSAMLTFLPCPAAGLLHSDRSAPFEG